MSNASRLAGLTTVLLMLVFCAPASAAIFVVEDGGTATTSTRATRYAA